MSVSDPIATYIYAHVTAIGHHTKQRDPRNAYLSPLQRYICPFFLKPRMLTRYSCEQSRRCSRTLRLHRLRQQSHQPRRCSQVSRPSRGRRNNSCAHPKRRGERRSLQSTISKLLHPKLRRASPLPPPPYPLLTSSNNLS